MFVAEYRTSFRVVQLESRVAEDLKPKGMCAAELSMLSSKLSYELSKCNTLSGRTGFWIVLYLSVHSRVDLMNSHVRDLDWPIRISTILSGILSSGVRSLVCPPAVTLEVFSSLVARL